jgi:hypothetical protein
MSIQSSGIICDVCGHYIGLMAFFGIEEEYDIFKMSSFGDRELHCHSVKCKDLIIKINEEQRLEVLPLDSPIRKAIEEFIAKEKDKGIDIG